MSVYTVFVRWEDGSVGALFGPTQNINAALSVARTMDENYLGPHQEVYIAREVVQ